MPVSAQPLLFLLADDPLLGLLQLSVLLVAVILLFLIFFAARDIILRTTSLTYMVICIAVVILLPVLGFLLYLLIRPARTIKEREMEEMVRELVSGRDRGEMK